MILAHLAGAGRRRSCEQVATMRCARARQVRDVAHAAARGARGGDPGGAHEPTILLADDDDVGRYVIATMLRRAGFTVREVADGAQAVAAALRAAARHRDPRRQDAGLDGFERLPAAEVRRRHAPHPGADAVGDLPRDRGAGRRAGDRRRRLPHPARRGAGAGRDRPRAAAGAQRRGRGAAGGVGVADDVRGDQPTRSRCSAPTAWSSAPTGRSLRVFGDARRARASPALEEARATGELDVRRAHVQRALRRGRRFRRRRSSTLSDITAARAGAGRRAIDLAHAAADAAAAAAARPTRASRSTPGTSRPSGS